MTNQKNPEQKQINPSKSKGNSSHLLKSFGDLNNNLNRLADTNEKLDQILAQNSEITSILKDILAHLSSFCMECNSDKTKLLSEIRKQLKESNIYLRNIDGYSEL